MLLRATLFAGGTIYQAMGKVLLWPAEVVVISRMPDEKILVNNSCLPN